MGIILLPPQYVQVDGPLIFLAGPIQGAPQWQARAISLLSRHPEASIASPRRQTTGGEFTDADYNVQVDWEHVYLERAGRDGVILFWLAAEAEHDCGRAYAQTTRFELAEAVTLHRLRGIQVVVGIDPGFTGARYIRRTLAKKAPLIPIVGTLEAACAAALELIRDPRI